MGSERLYASIGCIKFIYPYIISEETIQKQLKTKGKELCIWD